MEVNYLHMIWDVKIYLAKIKDGKGRDLYFLTKKNLPRGKWRFLTDKEIIFLKYFVGNSKAKR